MPRGLGDALVLLIDPQPGAGGPGGLIRVCLESLEAAARDATLEATYEYEHEY